MFVTEINKIYIHHMNMIYFFMVLVWFLYKAVDGSISHMSADLPEVVNFFTLYTFSIGFAGSGQTA